MATEKQKALAQKLLRLDTKVDGQQVVIDMYQSLQFTHQLDVEMEDSVLGYMVSGMLSAQAERQADDAKTELDEMRGSLDEYAREMEVLNRPTDEKVKAWVYRHPDYIAKRKEHSRLKETAGILKFFNRAFEMKVDLIPTRAGRAKRRQELEDRRQAAVDTAKSASDETE
jgi:hypothetical protein